MNKTKNNLIKALRVSVLGLLLSTSSYAMPGADDGSAAAEEVDAAGPAQATPYMSDDAEMSVPIELLNTYRAKLPSCIEKACFEAGNYCPSKEGGFALKGHAKFQELMEKIFLDIVLPEFLQTFALDPSPQRMAQFSQKLDDEALKNICKKGIRTLQHEMYTCIFSGHDTEKIALHLMTGMSKSMQKAYKKWEPEEDDGDDH